MLNVISDRTGDGVCIKWFMKIDTKMGGGEGEGTPHQPFFTQKNKSIGPFPRPISTLFESLACRYCRAVSAM